MCVQGERVVAVAWSEKSVVHMRAKTPDEAKDWLSVLRKNQLHYQRVNAPLTVVDVSDVSLCVCCIMASVSVSLYAQTYR